MRNLRIFILISLLSLSATGCYERVISERPFAGMASTRSDVPTAPDYREAQATFIQQQQDRNSKPFDPLGDLIFKPIGGAAESIGNIFSGGSDKPEARPAVQPPARPATSIGDSSAPPPEKP